jgi:hypothetical protein
MSLTRRAFSSGAAAVAVAAGLPTRPSAGEAVLVRRSIGDLTREQSPLIVSFRRGVDEMMRRDVADKTSWWFQANIHDVPDEEISEPLKPLVTYWQQCPHANYFFLSWHRMYLYYFERILRKASGDPNFVLPYWAYENPQQSSLPVAFLPDPDELGSPPTTEPVPPRSRRNPLARAKRFVHVDRRWIGLGDVARDFQAAMALDAFVTDDKLDARQAFGGVRASDAQADQAAGGIESSPHNLVHKAIGLEGDMGSPATAARDPIFWVHHANVDRMWVKWTDPAKGRVPPLDDTVWMTTKFTFVDEDGRDCVMTGADVLDTQLQLGYRYDDDPPRSQRLPLERPPMAVLVPGGKPSPALNARSPADGRLARGPAPQPVVLARTEAMRPLARETRMALPPLSRPAPTSTARITDGGRLRLVLKDVVAREGAPPYDVFLVSGNVTGNRRGVTSVRIGELALFGSGHRGRHAHAGGGATIAFDVAPALAQLARRPGSVRGLSVKLVRRAFPDAAGGEFVPPDPDPPRIGAIELLQL